MFDIVIRGGTVIDGMGAPARTADVAIVGDRIVEVGSADVGQNLPYRVTYASTNQSCWGNVLIEDKIAPTLTTKDTILQCYQNADSLLAGLTGKPTVIEGCGFYSLTFSDSVVAGSPS